SREQLLSCGVADGAILRRVRNGRLERVHHGLYRAPRSADVPLAVETAALLACGHDALLSHHSALTLWRLRPGIARPVHVTIPGDRGFPGPAGVKLLAVAEHGLGERGSHRCRNAQLPGEHRVDRRHQGMLDLALVDEALQPRA